MRLGGGPEFSTGRRPGEQMQGRGEQMQGRGELDLGTLLTLPDVPGVQFSF